MRFIILILLASLFCSSPARAEIDVTFYSHDFGESFPHAFFTMKGTLDDGQEIDTSHGFTATKISPAILWKSVTGAVQTAEQKYIDDSNPHFMITIGDEDYNKIMVIVAKWRDREQKSYNLKKRNCIHFTSEAIAALGYSFNPDTKFWRKPKKFLLEVLELNPSLEAIDYKKVKADIKAAKKSKDNGDTDEETKADDIVTDETVTDATVAEENAEENTTEETLTDETPSEEVSTEDSLDATEKAAITSSK